MIFVDIFALYQTIKTILSRKWRTPKRILWTIISIVSIFFVYFINVIGRLLDEVLFPRYRRVTIKPPVIIVANPRSGTTFLHRLMCHDEDTFTYFKLYHTIFPSITFYKIVGFFAFIDRFIGNPLSKFIGWMDKKLFKGWEHIHPMGLKRAEEDEALFLFPFATPALYMVFPVFREVTALRFADSLPEWKRRAIARYYKNSVKRFLYAYGNEDLFFLLKSVLFNGRMKIVNEIFPDARIIYLVRNPYEVLPSFISMFTSFWKVHSPEIPKDSELAREWARLGIDYYKYFHNNRHILKEDNYMVIRYTDLVDNPMGIVKNIYNKFGLTLSEKLINLIEEEIERSKEYKSNHEYSLEEYGIDRSWVYSELKEIFDEYNLHN